LCLNQKPPDTSTDHLPSKEDVNPLNAELNPICHFLALLGAHHILYVSRVRVKTPAATATAIEAWADSQLLSEVSDQRHVLQTKAIIDNEEQN
jgi:hypothetical protein